MSEHKTHESDTTRQPAGKPSQAEGERNPGQSDEQTQAPGGQPSQAEGDREMIEEKLGE
jgi:hypothetical protein